jgi:integrase
MTKKLAKNTVDSLRPTDRDIFEFDSQLPGFLVKVTPKGRKVFFFQYRSPEKFKSGKPQLRKAKLGELSSKYTVQKARGVAEKYRVMVSDGIDPQEANNRLQADAASDISLKELCIQYLDAAPTLVLRGKGRVKKPSTLETDRSNLTRHVIPLIGHLKIREITTNDITDMQADIVAGKTAKVEKTKPRGKAVVRGGTGVAGRCVAVLGGVFTYAIRKKLLEVNPVKGVAINVSEGRERYLRVDELARLGETLEAVQAEGVNPKAIAAVRLLIFTGARKGEILKLKWSEVDFNIGCLVLPDSKTGKKTIPLGAPALEVLASLTPEKGSPYVLPGAKEGTYYLGFQKAWNKIRVRAKIPDVRPHDLRHSFATTAAAGGNSLFLLGKVLGHTQARTTERYAHAQVDPLKALADKTSREIENAMKGKKGKVVSIGGGDG